MPTEIIETYTSDMSVPLCPTCGVPVEQSTDDPETPWRATCANGHEHTYQLDDEEID